MVDSSEYDFLDVYDDEDIVLVGESHADERHKEAESAILEEFKPEYVLTEVYGDRDPGRVDSTIEKYADVRTIADMKDLLEDDEEHLIEETIERAASDDMSAEREGKPFYKWSKIRRDAFASAYEEIKDDLDTSYSIEARIGLSSGLRSKNWISGARSGIFHLIDGVAELRNNDYRSKIAGNDLSKSERPDRNASTEDLISQYRETKEARDTRMAERAIHFANERETSRPVMNVVGSDHYEEVKENLEEKDHDVFGINLVDELN